MEITQKRTKKRRLLLFIGSCVFLVSSFHIGLLAAAVVKETLTFIGVSVSSGFVVTISTVTLLTALIVFMYQLWKFVNQPKEVSSGEQSKVVDTATRGVGYAVNIVAIICGLMVLGLIISAFLIPVN